MKRQRPVHSSLAVEEAIDIAAIRYIRDLAPRVAAKNLLKDPVFRRELAQLRAAEQRFRNRGVDIRQYLNDEVTHPALRDWQAHSDRLVDEMPGRSDLRRLRRRGILRMLDGEEIALPLDPPPMVALPPTPWRNAEWRTFRLRDELDYLEVIFAPWNHPAAKIRPVVDVLSHRQARAILDWPASRLDYWLSTAPHLLGGLRQIEITPSVREALDSKAEAKGKLIAQPRRTLHRIAFDTTDFMIWLAANQN